MRSIRTRLLAVALATGAVALAAPVAGASAQLLPGAGLPFAFPSGIAAAGGNQIGTAGCVGTNRPSIGGNNGSTSAQTCGAILSFGGPQIGQISSVIGPTIIGSPATAVNESAGSITMP
ncbi:MAG: hypothetical protein JWO02_19 [Solirubrobacterales bacterium]|nr:hypothetical protein [Solirubrobacterales bacterium]